MSLDSQISIKFNKIAIINLQNRKPDYLKDRLIITTPSTSHAYINPQFIHKSLNRVNQSLLLNYHVKSKVYCYILIRFNAK